MHLPKKCFCGESVRVLSGFLIGFIRVRTGRRLQRSRRFLETTSKASTRNLDNEYFGCKRVAEKPSTKHSPSIAEIFSPGSVAARAMGQFGHFHPNRVDNPGGGSIYVYIYICMYTQTLIA